MTEQEILSGNKLIAAFVGGTIHGDELNFRQVPVFHSLTFGDWLPTDEMEFHKSWDWLMPVVEKIESLEFEDRRTSVLIGNRYTQIDSSRWSKKGKDYNYPERRSCSPMDCDTKINSAWLAVVDFIKWYNQQSK